MEIKNLVFNVLAVTPTLLVYLTATIVGIVHLSKYKTPALLAMLGGMTAGVVSLGSFVIREVMWARVRDGDGENDFETTITITRGIGICGSVFEAVGVALIVFAVFAGRKAAVQADRDFRDRPDDRPRRPADRPRPDDRDDDFTPPASRPRPTRSASRPRS